MTMLLKNMKVDKKIIFFFITLRFSEVRIWILQNNLSLTKTNRQLESNIMLGHSANRN